MTVPDDARFAELVAWALSAASSVSGVTENRVYHYMFRVAGAPQPYEPSPGETRQTRRLADGTTAWVSSFGGAPVPPPPSDPQFYAILISARSDGWPPFEL